MKTVLVTGASSGIGRATTFEFARAGDRVFATVRRAEDAEALRQEASGLAVVPLVCDVRDLTSIRSAVATVRAATDRLDVLVNNAGYGVAVSIEDISVEDFWAVFEVDVRGLVAVTKEAMPLLGPGSTVVNISSLAGRQAVPLMSAYCGAKFAVEAITDVMRMEFRPLGIRVVAIEPGPVGQTRFSDHQYEVSEPYWNQPSRYAPAYEAVRGHREVPGPGAIPAETVARVVRGAAEARRPKPRYATQRWQAFLIRFGKMFPARWTDRAIAKYVGYAVTGGKP